MTLQGKIKLTIDEGCRG